LVVPLAPYEFFLWYKAADPFISSIAIAFFFATMCFIVAELSGNSSQVDRCWSILPALYAWNFALRPFWAGEEISGRVTVMAIIATSWSARLTYNFWRKGGYMKGDEDYRWPVLRTMITGIWYHIFNLTFISFYQNFLILYFSLPIYGAWLIRDKPWNTADTAVLGLWLALWLGEIISDQQQWIFQNRKKQLLGSQKYGGTLSGEFADGFISSGLWAYSRHPNFFCEFSLWWAYYFFTISGTGVIEINWFFGGPLLLTLLFQGSTAFTEYLSLQKYPRYAIYQKHVSRLMFWFPSDWSKKTE